MSFARTNPRGWSVPVLPKNTTRPPMKRNQRSRASIGMSSAKHGIACPHDGGAEIPGFDGRFFRGEPNIADGLTSAHRTFRAQGRYAVP
jgi:hypothetical protein